MADDLEKSGIELIIKNLAGFVSGVNKIGTTTKKLTKSFDLQKQSVEILGT